MLVQNCFECNIFAYNRKSHKGFIADQGKKCKEKDNASISLTPRLQQVSKGPLAFLKSDTQADLAALKQGNRVNSGLSALQCCALMAH